ncbi:leucine-rich repeat protein [Bacteroides cellulosilyticus]|uniref:leucine-rich repeat protein n=1 Tax=Bacteroides cellulosilyticus TaxID=246787 RepID=UPI00189F6CFC|nr:leucine-rich repeat protein [Bacteroides cellulosilyticus]
MKSIHLLYDKVWQVAFFVLLVTASSVKAETIHVATAGTLPELLGDRQNTVTELTLTGELNGTDFIFIRQMSALTMLDMSGAQIVAGGDAYSGEYKTENNKITDGLFAKWGSSDLTMPVTKIVLPQGVTYIGNSAFSGLDTLTEIVIPEGVKEIGNNAFNITGLTSVTLPVSLEVIGEDAFSQIWSLKSLHLPKNVRSIGSMFNHGIAEFTVDADNVYFVVKDGVLYSKNLDCLYWVPQSETTSYILPDGLKRISQRAFQFHRLVSTVEFPNSLEEIGEYAFLSCGLTSVYLPASISVIENEAFGNCPITSFTVAAGNTTFTAVDDVLFTKDMEELLYYSKVLPSETYVVPDAVKTISAFAFSNQCNLKNITFPEGLRKIGIRSFSETKLEIVDIPNSCIEIGTGCFDKCVSLTKMVLPSNLQTFELNMLYSCTALSELHCKSPIPYKRYIGGNAGGGIIVPESVFSLSKLYVPVGASAAYRADNLWNVFATIEEEAVAAVSGTEATVYLKDAGTLSVVLGNSVKSLQRLTVLGPVNGDDVQCFRRGVSVDNYTSELQYLDLRKATIVGGGAYDAYPGAVTTEETKENIVTKCMFQFMKSLEEVYLPESAVTIEERAFQGCEELKKVVWNGVVTLKGTGIFDKCYSLKEVHCCNPTHSPLADSNLFTDGTDVSKATLYVPFNEKETFQTLEQWKDFGEIREEAYVDTPGTLSALLGDRAVTETELVVSGRLNGTDIKALQSMSAMTSLDMTDAYIVSGGEAYWNEQKTEDAVIGKYFFGSKGELSNLVFVKLPNSVTHIGEMAFYQKKIVNVKLPDRLKGVGEQAFENCPLTTVHIPAGVNYIATGAFGAWGRLVKLFTVAEDNETYKAENGILYTKDGKTLYIYPAAENAEFKVPYGVEKISYDAFLNHKYLLSVSLPASVKSIGGRAFNNCQKLKSIDLSATSIVDLESGMFQGCYDLVSVSLPATIQRIESYCFSGCHNLRELKLPESVTFIGFDCFASCVSLDELIIPKNVIRVEANLFNNAKIGSIIWDAFADIKTAFSYSYWNNELQQYIVEEHKPSANILVYVKKATQVPTDWKNVIRDGMAEDIILQDTIINEYGNEEYPRFFAARPFKAKSVRYVRTFNRTSNGTEYESGRSSAGGWQTLVLPFTPTRIYHETKGELAPFNSGISGTHPFWLRKVADEGFISETVIQPNVPYIIAMPNHSSYDDEYNIVGEVVFSAESADGIDFPATPRELPMGGNSRFSLIPTYDVVYSTMYHGYGKEGVYCLNESTEYLDGKTYNIGSLFKRDYGLAKPFSAYVMTKEVAAKAPLYYSIGGEGGEITGLEEIMKKEDESLKVYTIGNVLYIDSDSDRSISIYDVTGRTVRVVEVREGSNTVTGLSSGFYFLEGKKVAIK